MTVIKMDEAEFQRFITETGKQQTEVLKVIRELSGVVDNTIRSGRWKSRAASNFASHWEQDKATLTKMDGELTTVVQRLQKHKGVAIDINANF